MTAINKKKAIVEEIKANIGGAALLVASDYRGISSNGANDFRAKIKESGANAKVYKNTLLRLALKDLGVTYPAKLLKGPTLLIHAEEDVVSVSKAIVKFIKENDITLIKGGLLQKSYIDESGIQELAKLPSRDELIAKTVYMIKAPLVGLVSSVSSPLRGLVAVLNQIKTKQEA